MRQISDGIVGFHAQQAAEKLLKAVLARNRVPYPFAHDLERLVEIVEEAIRETPPLRQAIVELTPWAVEFRYGDVPQDHLDRRPTLAVLEELLGWARERLS